MLLYVSQEKVSLEGDELLNDLLSHPLKKGTGGVIYGIPTLTKLASSNIWSNLSQIYGQTQICGQNCCLYMVKAKYMIKFYMIKLKYMVKRKLWSFFPYMVKHAANIWSKFKKIPLHNSHGYDVSIS